MLKHADAVAECVLRAFEALPAKAKPRTYPNGSREWVPLSGIVVSRNKLNTRSTEHEEHSNADVGHERDYQCVSLG